MDNGFQACAWIPVAMSNHAFMTNFTTLCIMCSVIFHTQHRHDYVPWNLAPFQSDLCIYIESKNPILMTLDCFIIFDKTLNLYALVGWSKIVWTSAPSECDVFVCACSMVCIRLETVNVLYVRYQEACFLLLV